MISSNELMEQSNRAWSAERVWLDFDVKMVKHLRQSGRSHLCRLVWRGVDLQLMEPVLVAQFDESLTKEIDRHLQVFNAEGANDPMEDVKAIEAIQARW